MGIMKDRTKRFLQKTEKDCLHIGNLIAWIIQEKHLKKKDVGDYLNIVPTTLNQYFKQSSVQVVILWRLSQALEYNLLADVAQRLNIPFETKAEKQLLEQLSAKEAEVQQLQMENAMLKSLLK
jgi:transcriptional regulator with XRE-family HTH domain